MNIIKNGAPMTNMLGINDKSSRKQVSTPEPVPTLLAKVYLFAQKGPILPQHVGGNSRNQMYGDDTFNVRKKWSNHATVMANTLNDAATSIMAERVIPEDAPPPSNFRIYIDMISIQIPEYERQEDGSFKLDTFGKPIETGTMIDGHQAKFVVKPIELGADGEDLFGQGTILTGDQVDAISGTQSRRIPIGDWEVSSQGSFGDNMGFRMWAPTIHSSNPVNDRIIQVEKFYPFRVACVSRTDVNSSPSITETMGGMQYVDVCFDPNGYDRGTDLQMYLGDEFLHNYRLLEDPTGAPPEFGPFGRFHLYQSNIDKIIKECYETEYNYADSFSDFTGEQDEMYRFNLIGGVSSQNVPYHSFRLISPGADSVRFTENSTIYATGGGDGTMNLDTFAKAVGKRIAGYADDNHPIYSNRAKYPESIFFDTGFPLETKYECAKFIASRKDVAVLLSTHIVGGKSMTAAEESAMAVALHTRLMMYPESDYFGTSVRRGGVVGRSGVQLNSQYKGRLPLIVELGKMMALYMGAGNRTWKEGFAFDEYPANEIKLFGDINVTFTPANVRNKDWDNGLIWAESYSERAVYFPAIKTVCSDDSSVLTSLINMMGCVELQKVGDRARRRFSGNAKLTDTQLIEQLNDFVDTDVAGRFDNRFVIVPETYFTSQDEARGYSWTQKIKIFAPNMRTVGSLIVEADRLANAPTQ